MKLTVTVLVIVVCLLLVAVALGWALEPTEQMELTNCCRDVGILQAAMIDSANAWSAGDYKESRDIPLRALKQIGLQCKWIDGGGSARLECR